MPQTPAVGKEDCILWDPPSSSGLGLLTAELLGEAYCNESSLLSPPVLTALHFLWLKRHIGCKLGGRTTAGRVIMIYSAGADRSP